MAQATASRRDKAHTTELTDLRAKLERLHDTASSASARASAAEGQLRATSGEIERMRIEQAAMRQEVGGKVQALSTQLRRGSGSVSAAGTSTTSLDADSPDNADSVQVTSIDGAVAESESIMKLRAAIRELKLQLASSEKQVSDKDGHVAQFKAISQANEEAFATLTASR